MPSLNDLPLSWIPRELRAKIEKVGGISRFLSEQCAFPWSAALENLPGAAKDPAITLLSFGLDDILRGYFRPRGLNTARKLRRRQRWYNKPTVPEIGEEIGKRIPGADAVKGRAYGQLEKFIWVGDSTIQRLLYYLMIFGVVTDTWYNSILALRKQGYCSTLGKAFLRAASTYQQYAGEPLPRIVMIPMQAVFAQRQMLFDGFSSFYLEERTQLSVTAQCTAFCNGDAEMSGFLTIDGWLDGAAEWRVLAAQRFELPGTFPNNFDEQTIVAAGRYRKWRVTATITQATEPWPEDFFAGVRADMVIAISPKTD